MKKSVLLITIFFCCYKSSFSQSIQLDSLFGNNGNATDKEAYATRSIATQKDGKAVVVGVVYTKNNSDFYVVRYRTDGTFDSTFSDEGSN